MMKKYIIGIFLVLLFLSGCTIVNNSSDKKKDIFDIAKMDKDVALS